MPVRMSKEAYQNEAASAYAAGSQSGYVTLESDSEDDGDKPYLSEVNQSDSADQMYTPVVQPAQPPPTPPARLARMDSYSVFEDE